MPNHLQGILRTAWLKGYQDFWRAYDKKENAFRFHTDAAREWLSGWLQAENEYRPIS